MGLLIKDRYILHRMGIPFTSPLSPPARNRSSGANIPVKVGLVAYLSIDFVAFSNGAGIHQWNVPREQFPTYAKVWSKIRTGAAKLMALGGACKGSWLCASDIFYQALDPIAVLEDFCAQTRWTDVLLHPCPDMAEPDLLYLIFLHHPLSLRSAAQNVGTSYPGTLL
jgi:hypothetical protein